MAEKFFEIPAELRIKATGPDARSILRVLGSADYEDFAPDEFPVTRDGVTLELITITFPGADDMAETEPDRY